MKNWRPSGALVLVVVLAGAGLILAGLLQSDDDSGGGGDQGTTAPSPPGVIVWAVGNGADIKGRGTAVARLVAKGSPQRFLYLGGVFPRGVLNDFVRGYAPAFGRFAAFTAPTGGRPEWRNRGLGYEPYWTAVSRSADSPAIKDFARSASRGRPPSYFSFEVGGWEILSLNSEADHDAKSAQLKWLKKQVSKPKGSCRLAFWYRPRYSAGPAPDAQDTDPFWDALSKRAVLVLNAGNRNMQRVRRRGITQLTAGAGGVGLQKAPNRRKLATFTNDTRYGALRLDLRPTFARFTFVAVDGRALDTGTIPCRPLR
jgi:acid phosphatase type 7